MAKKKVTVVTLTEDMTSEEQAALLENAYEGNPRTLLTVHSHSKDEDGNSQETVHIVLTDRNPATTPNPNKQQRRPPQ